MVDFGTRLDLRKKESKPTSIATRILNLSVEWRRRGISKGMGSVCLCESPKMQSVETTNDKFETKGILKGDMTKVLIKDINS